MGEWKDIPGFEGKYQFNGKDVFSIKKNILLKRAILPNNYIGFKLCVKRPKYKTFLEHRLVWWYYNGTIPNKIEINHKNGSKDQNNIENLELVTRKQNVRHAIEILKKSNKGANNGMSIFSELDVLKMKAMYFSGLFFQREIGKKFKTSQPVISHIILGKRWTYLKRGQKNG